ncbi:1049_t:CDS:2, partial [Entrophospora sp. SA101]
KTYCGYCAKAKRILDGSGKKYHVLELDKVGKCNGNQIQNYLQEKTHQSTVPNIFIGNKHIGGCDDLVAAKNDGTLETLLLAAPS